MEFQLPRTLTLALIVAGGLALLAVAYLLNVRGSGGSGEAGLQAAHGELQCVTGVDAVNPTRIVGSGPASMPVNQSFQTVQEAANFICLAVPFPRAVDDWRVVQVNAFRSHSLSELGARSVRIRYVNQVSGAEAAYEVGPGGAGTVDAPGLRSEVMLLGVMANLWLTDERPQRFSLAWEKDGFGFHVAGMTGTGDIEDILRLLESTR